MKNQIGLFLLALFLCSASLHCGQGDAMLQLDREFANIVGGTTYSGLPATGLITRRGNAHCTGTLIDSKLVLTAGHCVSGYSASDMKFVIGPTISNPEHVISVSKLQAHPYYNASGISNDIGLVTLASPAPVSPMGVVTHMDSSWKGTQLFFVGYGVNNGYNQTGAGIKRAVWMTISSVDATSFRYDDPGKNTCNGDSGGPAFYQDSNGEYLVAGVTSYGDNYCTSYGVDTRVDAYLDFLAVEQQPPADPCQGETYEGRCEAETVVWCENNQVKTQDCASEGKLCVFDQTKKYYACRDKQVQQDPCQGETYEGRCDGNTVVYCENDQVKSVACQRCGWNSQKGYYDCL